VTFSEADGWLEVIITTPSVSAAVAKALMLSLKIPDGLVMQDSYTRATPSFDLRLAQGAEARSKMTNC
jgi:hypothetical protein